ncbi:MAG TPA: ChaN family lipoprotein [Burkholderiaceae bacterium]|nr:ChaN family lipoprotein [Burkholderiaceae bacterium]
MIRWPWLPLRGFGAVARAGIGAALFWIFAVAPPAAASADKQAPFPSGPHASRHDAVPTTIAQARLLAPSGAPVAVSSALQRMRQAEFLLLGEVHDNALHHALRAELLARLGQTPRAVVFEQLPPLDSPTVPPPEAAAREAWLDARGFDRRGWRWPLHRPLFDAVAQLRWPIDGAALPPSQARAIARDPAALPAPLAEWLALRPLADDEARQLADDLFEGHCALIPRRALSGMARAQRARDAAMAQALLSTGTPSVLIAGNGHVRRDYGVPLLLRARRPGAAVLSVGVLEVGLDGQPPPPEALAAYDLIWVTPRAQREDPCRALAPAPAGGDPAPAR